MASKMLLIITYSRIVFWLILSVTCRHIVSHKFKQHNKQTVNKLRTYGHYYSSLFLYCFVSPSPDTTAAWDKGSSDSLSRLHRGGCPVSPSGPAEATNKRTTVINWEDANRLSLPTLKDLVAHLHPLLGFVEPHEHVDDVEAGRWLVLLVNAAEKCAESLRERGTGVAKRLNTFKCSMWNQKCISCLTHSWH